ncbi:hypothetical protein SKAU_G00070770 [Synaphobranchus kaupii]|uniref:Uncharacterized protein n=1 Tax=Synaphobranchus kaupii TaxID=118154 RepID=A0A9Q1G7T2_SYNKA|nr:hypothetical protein SKAU_G00070770 [Synaphobranchus kaupii]
MSMCWKGAVPTSSEPFAWGRHLSPGWAPWWASACEFADIVVLLLQAGADPSITDQEGSSPEEVTDSRVISSLLRQYVTSKGNTEELHTSPSTATCYTSQNTMK